MLHVLVLLAAASAPVDASAAFAACATITSDSVRLTCYDAIAHTKPASNASDAMPPPMSDELVQGLQAIARKHSKGMAVFDYIGLSQRKGESSAIAVISARAQLVSKTAHAISDGGEYSPPAAARADIVVVQCGDAELRSLFECASLKVTLPSGAVATPIHYDDSPSEHHNAMGAKWTTRGVSASYDPRALRDGFVVDYQTPDGTAWKFEIPAKVAAEKLLLTLDDESARSQKK